MYNLKRTIALAAMILISVSLFAFSYAGSENYGGDGVLIPLGSRVYDYMDALFIYSGKAVPSTSRPWTAGEARHELSRLEGVSFSGEAKALYEEVSAILAKGEENELSLTLSLSPEAYAHTNGDYDTESSWAYGYTSRNHLGRVALDNSTGGFYGHLELSMGQGLVSADDVDNAMTIKQYVESTGRPWTGLGTHIQPGDEAENVLVLPSQANYQKAFNFNMPGTNNDEVNMPRRAYLDYTGSNFNVGFYKAQKEWGLNRSGNFVFDSHNDYYDTISLKTFSEKFNLEYTVMVPEQYIGGTNWVSEYSDTSRLFLAHRLEYRFFDNLTLALSENLMYQADKMNLSIFNPAFFYHNNVNDRQFNALAHVELSYVLPKGFLLYAQYGVDQGSFPGFEDPNTEDQAMGYSIGAKSVFFALDGLCTVSLEALGTTPALYRPTNSSDFIINYNQIYADGYYRYPFFSYIGYEQGGDAVEFRLDGDYYRGGLHCYTMFDVLLKGSYTMWDKYVKPLHKTTLSDGYTTTVTFENGAEYEAQWKAFPYKLLGDLAVVWNSEKGFDAQLTVGASVSYTLK